MKYSRRWRRSRAAGEGEIRCNKAGLRPVAMSIGRGTHASAEGTTKPNILFFNLRTVAYTCSVLWQNNETINI